MVISYSSFFMAVLWSSVIIIFLYIGQKKKSFIKYFGVTNLVILYLVCGMRLLLPIEFPFVKIVGFKGVLAQISERVDHNQTDFFGYRTTIAQILLGIWVTGILIVLVCWRVRYCRAIRKIYILSKYRDLQSEKVFARVQKVYRRKLHVKIWKSSQIDVPMGIGIFQKAILLPEDCYTDKELYYILLHEYTHFINRDLTVKMLVHIFCCIFWWNPNVYLLKKDLDQTLEIKCDLAVAKSMDKDNKAFYLKVIIAMLENAGAKKAGRQVIPASRLFQPGMDAAVLERFQIVMEDHLHPGKTKLFYYGWIVLLCAGMGFSYLFQFQAESEQPLWEISPQEDLTPENTCIIDNGDGTYTMIDLRGQAEDLVTDDGLLIEDMKSRGFTVEKGKGEK